MLAYLAKDAANRRFRTFLHEKVKEFFPQAAASRPKAVLDELVDNAAAALLEWITPGRNKILLRDDYISPVSGEEIEATDPRTGAPKGYSKLQELRNKMGEPGFLKEFLKNVLSGTWSPKPANIKVDVRNLDNTFGMATVNNIKARMSTMDASPWYKDKERMEGARSRLGQPFPGKDVPWNKDQPLMMTRADGSRLYEIREGWHRMFAMVAEAVATRQPEFTVSAYVSETTDTKRVIADALAGLAGRFFPRKSGAPVVTPGAGEPGYAGLADKMKASEEAVARNKRFHEGYTKKHKLDEFRRSRGLPQV